MNEELESDFANFAKLATNGTVADEVKSHLAMLVRKYRASHPFLSTQFNQCLQLPQSCAAGQSTVGHVPVSNQCVLPVPLDDNSLTSLVRVFDDRKTLPTPILDSALAKQVDAIAIEHAEYKTLKKHGIRPSRSAMFIGPSGVGKTLSARYVAARIGKPLWVLELATFVSGVSRANFHGLRLVLEKVKRGQAVLLLEDLDCIVKHGSDDLNASAFKCMVLAILKQIDQWPDTSLLLAASNHPELIDRASWHRFDAVLSFDVPGQDQVVLAIQRFLDRDFEKFKPWISLMAASLVGRSFAEVERSILHMRRNALIHRTEPAQLAVEFALRHGEETDRSTRRELAISLAKERTMSHNQISDLTGVSRDTLRKYAGPSPLKGRGLKKG